MLLMNDLELLRRQRVRSVKEKAASFIHALLILFNQSSILIDEPVKTEK
jgi:hypothetical protein